MEAVWPLLPATMAIGPCHGSDPGQDQGGDRLALCGPLHRVGRRQPQPRAARLGAYFRYGNAARKFADIDSYVHERLAIFASIKHGLRHHRNWTRRFAWAWLGGLGVYRLSGRVRSGAAHALR